MNYFIAKLLLNRGIEALHLSGISTTTLIIGALVSFYLLKKTRKLQSFLFGLAVTIAAVSILTYKFVPESYAQYRPEWLAPQIVIPIAIILAGVGLILSVLRNGSRILSRVVIGVAITSLLSGGYVYSFLNAQNLGNIAQYIPFLPSNTIQTAKNEAQHAVQAVQAVVVPPDTQSGSKGQTGSSVDYGKLGDKVPSQSLASSVLSENVKKQLGNSIAWNGYGAFVIDGNKNSLNTNVASAPYATNTPLNSKKQLGVANAWLNKSSRQYENRADTGNAKTINPAGYLQQKVGGEYLYNRGHLLGYALIGSIKGFDASEANPNNIATQTEWANQSQSSQNTGQNYYEGLVRKALDNNEQVRYRVTPIYDGGIVPVGNHIEAKSKNGSLEFNVFVPNVEPAVTINYATGQGTIK